MNIDFSRILTAGDRAGQSAARARERERDRLMAVLQQSDWLALREAETGIPMPAGIRADRVAARQGLSELALLPLPPGDDPLP